MATVWLELRADLRQRELALLSLALLLGLIGGVVLTATAGARRTGTAYPRLLSWANASQVDLIAAAKGFPADYFAALAKLPQIAQLSTVARDQAALPRKRKQTPRGAGHSSPLRALTGSPVDRPR